MKTLLLALLLTLSPLSARAYPVAKFYEPRVTYWVATAAGGYWLDVGERFWLVDLVYANNIPWDLTRVEVLRPCSAYEWYWSGVPVVDVDWGDDGG